METLSFLDALEAISNISSEEKVAPTVINNSESASLLIKALKAAAINFRTLHRNLIGGNWFDIHELLGDYYDKLDDFEDSIVENLISLGISDVKVNCEDILEPKNFNEKEALQLVKDTLVNIKELSVKTRSEINIPTSVAPAFDELENYCQIEAEYKLAHYFD